MLLVEEALLLEDVPLVLLVVDDLDLDADPDLDFELDVFLVAMSPRKNVFFLI